MLNKQIEEIFLLYLQKQLKLPSLYLKTKGEKNPAAFLPQSAKVSDLFAEYIELSH